MYTTLEICSGEAPMEGGNSSTSYLKLKHIRQEIIATFSLVVIQIRAKD
jgi:hypothetical protein